MPRQFAPLQLAIDNPPNNAYIFGVKGGHLAAEVGSITLLPDETRKMQRTIPLIAVGLLFICFGCQNTPHIKGCDKLASDARKQLLAPPRHEVRLSMVDVPTAVREIQKTYGWTPNPDMHLEEDFSRVRDARVTINRKAGTLAEVLADLCNQTGFLAFEDFENIGIYGGIGHEETGGRGLAFAKDGLLLLLSVNQLQRDKPKTYTIFPFIVDAVPWLHHEHARLQIDELVYPDGTRVQDLKKTPFSADLPYDPLLANHGLIKFIRGILWIQLPKRVAVEVINLQPETIPREERREHRFLRIVELKETKKGWVLACEYGHRSLMRKEPRLDYGHVDVLDENGSPIKGQVENIGQGYKGSGDSISNDFQSIMYDSYNLFEIEFPIRPASVRWTYVTQTEEHRIPVSFKNCRVPDVIWRPKPEEVESQQAESTVPSGAAPSTSPDVR